MADSMQDAELYQRRFRAIFEQAEVPTQLFSAEGRVLACNNAWYRWAQLSPKDVADLDAKGYRLLNDPTLIKSGIADSFRKALSGTSVQAPPVFYNLADLGLKDHSAWIQSNLYPIPDSSGKTVEVLILHHDVSELMRNKRDTEVELELARERASKERDDAKILIQSIIDKTHAVVYVKDKEGKYLYINGQWCRIFDVKADQILGKTDEQLFPKELAEGFRKNDLHVQATRSHFETEEVAVHADGKKHEYISLKFPLEDSEGNLVGIGGVSTDITALRSMEKELSTAKRMEAVGLLAGGIAHDFNNVLEMILLITDTLLMKNGLKRPDSRASIKSIKSAAQSASLLTRQLLAFGRKKKSQPTTVELDKIVRGMKEIFRNALGEAIHFSVDIAPVVWPIRADPMEVEQVLTNLCLNARDAMPQGGTLEVSVKNVRLAASSKSKSKARRWRIGKPLGDYVELSVRDMGVGIPAGILDRIFEPFFSTKKEDQGTGLGLTTVYGIVESAGGDIAIESEEGQGTVFRICFPRVCSPRMQRESSPKKKKRKS